MFRRCPKAWLAHDAKREADTIGDVLAFQKWRLLPKAGGLHDQDPRFLEALDVVESETARIEEAKRGKGQ